MPYRARHARRSGQRRRALAVVGGLAATALPFVGTGTASAATPADWETLAMCESGGNWAINTGNGYYGGLQFSSPTWLAYGGGNYAPRADLASPTAQMTIADGVLAAQGWNAWPSCSRSTGLYGSPTTSAPPPPPPPPLVQGAILAHYDALGGAAGFLGQPLSAQTGSIDGGAYNVFQNGLIYWSPATGAWEANGAIRQEYAALGAELGQLGYPRSDELGTPLRPGRFNAFQGGSVYWSPTTGAHEVWGAIMATWAAQGWENGPAGFPTTDELPAAGGGVVQHYENGTMAFTGATGVRLVRGAINSTWVAMGADQSALGMPRSNEFAIPGGRKTVFEHGSITWTPGGGAAVHRA